MSALLERLAWVYGLLAVPVLLLPGARPRAVGGAGLALLGLAAAATRVASPGEASRGFDTVNTLLAVAGLLGVAGALFLAWHRRTPDPAASLAPNPAETPVDPLLLLGLLVALFAPQLVLLGLGAALGFASAIRATIRRRQLLALLPLLASASALGAALGLLLTIMGPLGGSVAELTQGPFSPAAERLLALLIGSAAFLQAGVPPLHRVPRGLALAPLSAVLLCRLVVGPLPEGLLVLQAPAMLLLGIACSWSAFSGRWRHAAVAGGLLALWSGAHASVLPGTVLVAWGWLVETGTAMAARRGTTLGWRWRGIVALPAVLAALPALTASLRAQVLLSTLVVSGCAVSLLRTELRGPGAQRAALY